MLTNTSCEKKEACCMPNKCSVCKDKDMKISELERKNKILTDKLSHYENLTIDSPSSEVPSSIPCSGCESLKSANGKLLTIVKDLNEKIALLKGGRDSHTSSTAPSGDFSRSNSNSLRTPSGKKTGGQPGHTGHTLPLSETPDEIIDHKPVACSCCGKSLEEVPEDSYTRRQLVDIPPIRPVYTEHRSHIKICPSCGTKNRGVFPERLTAPIQYGPVVEATVAYLSVYQYVSYSRIVDFFKDCLGLTLSEGVIDSYLDKFSNKVIGTYEKIRELIHRAPVVGADETGCKMNGKKHSNNSVVFSPRHSRSKLRLCSIGLTKTLVSRMAKPLAHLYCSLRPSFLRGRGDILPWRFSSLFLCERLLCLAIENEGQGSPTMRCTFTSRTEEL